MAVLIQGVFCMNQDFFSVLTARRSRSTQHSSFPDTSDLEASQGVSFEVTESVLFQSELLRSGARYTALERFPLRAEAGT